MTEDKEIPSLQKEVYVWVNEQDKELARLDVDKKNMSMRLRILPLESIDIEDQMREFNKMGLYPNERLENKNEEGYLVFDIECHYNWNARQRDFRTNLTNWLGFYPRRVEESNSVS